MLFVELLFTLFDLVDAIFEDVFFCLVLVLVVLLSPFDFVFVNFELVFEKSVMKFKLFADVEC